MNGGFTKIPKLQVEDLGAEGTGDRIALFDGDGKIVGYMLSANLGDGYVPLSGTEVGKPITGDLEFKEGHSEYRFTKTNIPEDIKQSIIFSDSRLVIKAETIDSINEMSLELYPYFIRVSSSDPSSIGLVADYLFDKQNDPYAFAQLGDINSKTIVRDTGTITNATTETDAFLKTIDANTIGENEVINGTFIFNCLAATTKVDYKVIIAGIDVAVFNQVGYQAVNESTEISIKVFRDGNKLKVSSSLIGGTTVVYSFYYETTSFDFLESNDLKVTMEATNANEVSVQFSELILSK